MSDDINLKMQLTRELEKAIQFQKVNQELYDQLTGTLYWLLKYANKQNIVLPNLGMIHDSINKIHLIMDGADSLIPMSSPKNQHPFTTPEDSTEPRKLTNRYMKRISQ